MGWVCGRGGAACCAPAWRGLARKEPCIRQTRLTWGDHPVLQSAPSIEVPAVKEDAENENLHPGHLSIRLQGYDYSAAGFYFVTICTYEKKCILGAFHEGHLELAALGKAARECWLAIPQHFARVHLNDFVIMPNHLHGIIEIAPVGAQHAAPQLGADPHERHPAAPQLGADPHERHPAFVKPGSLGAIIRSYKAAVTRKARRELAWHGEVWQRNYFERVLRDGKEIADASRYIAENPMMWELDQENLSTKR
jgi:putative transposase